MVPQSIIRFYARVYQRNSILKVVISGKTVIKYFVCILDMTRTKLFAGEKQPNTRCKRWSSEKMIMAIKKVRAKEMGLKKASRLYEVPKTSLKRYVLQTEKSPEEAVNSCLGRKPILPKELEKMLVDYLLRMERTFSFCFPIGHEEQ